MSEPINETVKVECPECGGDGVVDAFWMEELDGYPTVGVEGCCSHCHGTGSVMMVIEEAISLYGGDGEGD